MARLGFKICVLMLGLSLSAWCSANLIINGSFEDTHVRENSWAWFYSDDVSGWQGSNIEIWDRFQRVDAFEGTQHAELNAHPSNGQAFSIFQNFKTQVGSTYDLSFAYRARKNDNEAFLVSLMATDDSQIFSSVMDDHSVGQWSVFNTRFVAIDWSTTLTFTSITPSTRTVGNFLDDIVITQIQNNNLVSNNVAEPAGIVLFGFALMAMVHNRRKNPFQK